jgi:hypothetical protein
MPGKQVLTEFKDLYGNACSLQKSSAAQYDSIWFGISKPEINVMIDGGWKGVAIPEGAVVHSRMHLSQKMVKELLPALQYFVEHGELPDK